MSAAPVIHPDEERDGLPLILLPDSNDEGSWLELGDRLLRTLIDTQAELAANKDAEQKSLTRIQNGWADTNLPLTRRIARLEASLEQVARSLPMRGKKKSRDLAFGTLGFREAPKRLDVQDADALESWLNAQDFETHEKLVRIVKTEKVDKKALDAFAIATKTVPDGCQWVGGEEAFYIKTSEPHA